MARTFEEIEETVLQELVNFSNRPLDLSEGSVISAIMRSIAGSQAKQEQNFEQAIKSQSILTAEGDDLDNICYWITRSKGSKARGFVIVENPSNESINLSKNEIISNPNTELLYKVIPLSQSSISIPPRVRTPVPIEAKQEGPNYNLSTGERLLSLEHPNLVIRVGNGVTLDGKTCGSIQNGSLKESDESFRLRGIKSAKKEENPTKDWIEQQILSLSQVNNVQIDTVGGGLIRVLTDQTLEADLEAIENEIKSYVPIGVEVSAISANLVRFPVDITIRSDKISDQSKFSEKVKASVFHFSRQVRAGGVFNPKTLERRLRSLTESIEVVSPTDNIQTRNTDLIYPETVNITYVAQL